MERFKSTTNDNFYHDIARGSEELAGVKVGKVDSCIRIIVYTQESLTSASSIMTFPRDTALAMVKHIITCVAQWDAEHQEVGDGT